MKKGKAILISLAVILALAIASIAIFSIPSVRIRLYLGDRITGTFKMTVNSDKESGLVSGESVEHENDGKARLDFNGSDFYISGGEYGSYHMIFNVNNDMLAALTGDVFFKLLPEHTPITVTYINSNRYNITSIDITADLTEENGEWILTLKAEYEVYDGKNPVHKTAEQKIKYGQSAELFFGL